MRHKLYSNSTRNTRITSVGKYDENNKYYLICVQSYVDTRINILGRMINENENFDWRGKNRILVTMLNPRFAFRRTPIFLFCTRDEKRGEKFSRLRARLSDLNEKVRFLFRIFDEASYSGLGVTNSIRSFQLEEIYKLCNDSIITDTRADWINKFVCTSNVLRIYKYTLHRNLAVSFSTSAHEMIISNRALFEKIIMSVQVVFDILCNRIARL